jgi:predicted PurR-regulated permease PerM
MMDQAQKGTTTSQTDDEVTHKPNKYERVRYALNIVLLIIGVGIILWAVGMVLGKVSLALDIVALSLVFVFFLHSLVSYFEKKGIPRSLGTLFAFLIALTGIAVLVIIIGPLFGKQITAFVVAIPNYINQIIAFVQGVWGQYGYLLANDMINNWVNALGSALSSMLTSFASNTATGVLQIGVSIGNAVLVLTMSMVAAFWILMDLPRMGREARVVIGPKYIDDVMVVTNICSRVAGGYVKGVCIASCSTGIIAGTGFAILGMPYAVVLGLIIALMNVIPYLGPWIGGAIAALIGLFVSPLTGIIAIVITVFAQQFTDTFITPRVMSSTVDIHPVLVIVALIAGGAIGGIVGMIIAVPLTAAAKAVYVYYFEKKTGRQLVTEDGAFFKGKGLNSKKIDPALDATDSFSLIRSTKTRFFKRFAKRTSEGDSSEESEGTSDKDGDAD